MSAVSFCSKFHVARTHADESCRAFIDLSPLVESRAGNGGSHFTEETCFAAPAFEGYKVSSLAFSERLSRIASKNLSVLVCREVDVTYRTTDSVTEPEKF